MIPSHSVHESNENQVKIWSKIRLPLEPKGTEVELWDLIRNDIDNLTLQNEGRLYSCLCTNDRSDFDVENILFYNVRKNVRFSQLSKKGILFERGFTVPKISQARNFGYYYEYNTNSLEAKLWKNQEDLALFEFSLDSLSSLTLEKVLKGIKAGKVLVKTGEKNVSMFGISVIIKTKETVKIVTILKSLLDGIISRFHVHLGSDQFYDYVGQNLGLTLSDTKQFLTDKTTQILGTSNIGKAPSKGAHLNPNDEGLVIAEIIPQKSSIDSIEISGKIFSVEQIVSG